MNQLDEFIEKEYAAGKVRLMNKEITLLKLKVDELVKDKLEILKEIQLQATEIQTLQLNLGREANEEFATKIKGFTRQGTLVSSNQSLPDQIALLEALIRRLIDEKKQLVAIAKEQSALRELLNTEIEQRAADKQQILSHSVSYFSAGSKQYLKKEKDDAGKKYNL